eukprot:2172809-Pyramimonas_sp.AAC.1
MRPKRGLDASSFARPPPSGASQVQPSHPQDLGGRPAGPHGRLDHIPAPVLPRGYEVYQSRARRSWVQ